MTTPGGPLPAWFFDRDDPSPDDRFYRPTRLVTHIDDEAVAAVGVRQVLVTVGSRGSILFCGGTRHRIVANPVDTDPTGAGDAFMACYLAARARGETPLASARSATRLVEDLLAGRLR